MHCRERHGVVWEAWSAQVSDHFKPHFKKVSRTCKLVVWFGRSRVFEESTTMAFQSGALLLACVLVSAFFGVAFSAQSCSVLLASNRGYANCLPLPRLSTSLAYRIRNDSAIDFAFSGSAPSANGWVGWGINPTSPAMVGTQALIAYSIGGVATVNTYAITGAMKGGSPCVPGTLSLNFTDTSTVISGTDITIYTTLQGANSYTMNHVWNQGPSVDATTLAVAAHALSGESVESVTSVTLTTSSSSSGSINAVELPNQKLKNNHGIISAVAWGLLLPLGVMAARYIRPFSGTNPAWFYIHVTCQCAGYILGVVAWALGLRLHSLNDGGAVPTRHRNLGMSIFALATLQVLALILRPKPDAKFRKYWNVYHHSVGYATLVVIIINIFEGLDVLQPEDKWTTIYIIILCVLGAFSLAMEIITWTIWLRQRSQNKGEAMYGGQFKGTTNQYRSGHHEDVV